MTMNIIIKLSQLEQAKLPTETLACATCPNAMWFANTSNMSCLCKEIRKVIWESNNKNLITLCSGREEAIAKQPVNPVQTNMQQVIRQQVEQDDVINNSKIAALVK